MKTQTLLPLDMQDAFLLNETGWSPEELDRCPIERLEKFLLYKQVHHVIEFGGEFMTEGKGEIDAR